MIIRRILGPYLSPTSKQNLQKTLDISLRQGRFIFQSLELDGQVLTDKLKDSLLNHDDNNKNNSQKYEIRIQTVFIQELSISLFLEYEDDDDDEYGYDPYAYTGISGGGGYSSNNGAKLVAKVELNGVNVQLEIEAFEKSDVDGLMNTDESIGTDVSETATTATATTNHTKDDSDATMATATAMPISKGFLQSYVQAALDSLKLTLDIQDLSIQISSPSSSSSSSWIMLHLKSLSYKDSILPPPPAASTSISISKENDKDTEYNLYEHKQHTSSVTTIKSKVILGKEICLDTLLIQIGRDSTINKNHDNDTIPSFQKNSSLHIMRYNGMATVIATIMSNKTRTVTDPISSIEHNNESNIVFLDNMERHLEIALDDNLYIDITPMQVQILHDMFYNHNSTANKPTSPSPNNISTMSNNIKAKYDDKVTIEEDDEDEQDLGLLSNILKQQHISTSSPLMFNDYYGKLNKSGKAPLLDNEILDHVPKECLENNISSSINGLFHTNQEGYSHYCNVLASSMNEGNDKNDDDKRFQNDCSEKKFTKVIISTVSFCLKEVALNIKIESLEMKLAQMSDDFVSGTDEMEKNYIESILLTMIDLNVMMSQSSYNNESKFSLDVKHLTFEHVLVNDLLFCKDRMMKQADIVIMHVSCNSLFPNDVDASTFILSYSCIFMIKIEKYAIKVIDS